MILQAVSQRQNRLYCSFAEQSLENTDTLFFWNSHHLNFQKVGGVKKEILSQKKIQICEIENIKTVSVLRQFFIISIFAQN